jgi:hypothetical protein
MRRISFHRIREDETRFLADPSAAAMLNSGNTLAALTNNGQSGVKLYNSTTSLE